MHKKGFLVTIASPSGGGKSTICREVLKRDKNVNYSISWTTRAKRGNEVDGIDYNYTSIEDFKKKIDENHFLEYAKVHENYYGTSKDFIDKSLENEAIILLDIDVQGVELVKKQGYSVVTIFILPPSAKILKDRLINRGTDSVDVINKRLNNAKKEIDCIAGYDYLVINDEIEMTVTTVMSILNAESNKFIRFIDPVSEFFNN